MWVLFPQSASGAGGDFLRANSCPQPLVIRPGSVSTLILYHARGSPLGVALSWVVSATGSPSGGMGTSQVRLLPTGTRTMAWSHLSLLFVTVLGCALTWQCFNLAMPSSCRRLTKATPHQGYTFSRRRLLLATPCFGDAPKRSVCWLPSLDSSGGPTICWLWLNRWLWLWSTPGDGTIHKPPSLELTLVSAKRLRPRPTIHVAFLLMWHSFDQLTWHSLSVWRDILYARDVTL